MKIDTLEPNFKTIVETVIKEANEATGRNWLCVQGRRTIAEQNALYAQGRTKPGVIVTNAKGGSSAHNFGLAADLAPEKSKGIIDWNAPASIWAKMGDIAESHGLTWGGNFKSIHDVPHIEHPSWKEQQALYRAGKLQVA